MPQPSRLAVLRFTEGLSQQDLADRAGLSRETISRIESGVHRPGLDTAQAIAEALQRSVDDVFLDAREPQAA